MIRVLLLALCCALPVAAQQTPPPEVSPLPPERPDPEDRQDAMPVPEPEPVGAAPAENGACLAELDALGAVYQTLPPRSDPNDAECGIENPIALAQVVPGVDLTPAAELRCETALELARWTSEVVQPAANRMVERGALTGMDNGSGYICRRRNNAPDGKLSEHSFGNGIDIMGFRFADGAPIAVEPREREGTMAEAFQRTVRAGACLYFSTVLGPGTDAAHADHLHMDIRQRKGGFRLCQ